MLSATYDVDGLRVHVVDMPGARTCAGLLHVHAGCAHDAPAPDGVAHLAEHVTIALAAAGVDTSLSAVRGGTDNTITRFSTLGAAEDLVAAGAVLASLLEPPEVTPARVEAERRAVLVELAQHAANPYLLLGPVIAQASLPGHGLAASTLADAETLARISTADVNAFIRAAYRRPNAELALAGPIPSMDELLSSVRAHAATAPDRQRDGDGRGRVRCAAGAERDSRAAARLDASLSGLVVFSLARADRPSGQRDAMTAAGGVLETAVGEHGFPLLGRTTISAGQVAVDVLCWHAGSSAGELTDTLAGRADELWHAAADQGSLAVLARRRRQDAAYAAVTPIGRAAAALSAVRSLPHPRPEPGDQPPPFGPHLWRVEHGQPRRCPWPDHVWKANTTHGERQENDVDH